MRDIFQDPQWMPKTAYGTESYIYFVFLYTCALSPRAGPRRVLVAVLRQGPGRMGLSSFPDT